MGYTPGEPSLKTKVDRGQVTFIPPGVIFTKISRAGELIANTS